MSWSSKSNRLAGNNNIWRVDGVGEVSAHPEGPPTIELCFSGIKRAALDNPYASSAVDDSHLTLKPFASEVRDFPIGSVWDGETGNCLKRFFGSKLSRIKVDTSQARLVTLSQRIALKRQEIFSLVPPTHLKLARETWLKLRRTQYCLVPIVDDEWLDWAIIPASELYRAYIGVSSRFYNSALTGGLRDYVDWDRRYFSEGQVTVTIEKPLEFLEKRVISRAAASVEAFNSLTAPHKYLSKATRDNKTLGENNRLPLVIKSTFPFLDTTHLTVTGKRMPLGRRDGKTKEEWAFYVMYIHQCNYKMDFETTFITNYSPISDPYIHRNDSPSEVSIIKPNPPPPYDGIIDINDLPADKGMKRLAGINFKDPFPGMVGEFKNKHPFSDHGGRDRKFADAKLDEVTGYTHADGNYSKDSKGNQGLSTADIPAQSVSRGISLFIDAVIELRKIASNRRWTVTTRMAEDGTIENGEKVAMFPFNIGRNRTWHKISKELPDSRTRQVVWVEIYMGAGEYLYIFEMELRPEEKSGQCTIIIRLNNEEQMSEPLFKELLILTAIQNRWPLPRHKWKSKSQKIRANKFFSALEIKRLKHPVSKASSDKQETDVPKKICPNEWAKNILLRIDQDLLIVDQPK